MKLSYSALWDDTAALLRAHGALVVAIAGVFLFLPALLAAHFLPRPEAQTIAELVPLLKAWFAKSWLWVVLQSLLSMLGTLAILRLVFAPRGTTVAAAIAAGALLVPTYFIAWLICSVVIGFGFVLLIVPGLYLYGRLAPVSAVIAAETRRNPIEALTRCWELTKGNGWRVLGILLLVGVAGFIALGAVQLVLGLLAILLLGKDTGALIGTIIGAATGAALQSVLTLLVAAIYRALTGGASAAVPASTRD